jgi:N6-L-threonylcarbamoyladenine synthase
MTCHAGVSKGEIILKAVRPSKGFKAETFMTMVRWQLVNQLRAMGTTVSHTYGYITKSARVALGLPKSHINDAFVIAGGQRQKRLPTQLLIRQVRKCNRKLRRGDRSHIPNTAPRFLHAFQRYDKVRWKGHECFIFGRRSSGYFDLRKLDTGKKLSASANVADIVLLESARTLLTERTSGSSLWQNHRVSAA